MKKQFQVATLKNQTSITYSNHSDDSEDNDENLNLEKILDKYKSKDRVEELGNTEQFIIDALQKDSNACLICIEIISNKDAIWNCDLCFAQFHLNCIQQWIKDGAYLNTQSQSDTLQNKSNIIPWNCPKCRKDYPQSSYPQVYFCYCRKVKNPPQDPWSVPHSCNQTCDREKSCGHHCLMLCHPGPCPPCPKMVSLSCYCGNSNAVARRCSNKYWSCNKVCNRLLECKQHRCIKICHQSSCPDCTKTSIQYCICKKFQKEVLCTQTVWKCEEICGKTYSCGFHKCEVICHKSGECGECPRSKQRTCPCGKTKFVKPCTDEIPTCGDTCDKLLNCGLHKCVRRCHNGPCDTCRQIVTKRCRCGQTQKELPCCVQFTCETKCTKVKNCGKHKCNRKCCDGNCAPCEQLCNKQLACKNHKCNMQCHRGACYPCPLQVEIFCPCDQSKLKIPCAKSKMKIKVQCRQLCKKPPDCHHESRQSHRCHESNCPPCVITCNKIMKCQHICEANCHSAVPTEIIENLNREGPWEPLRKKTILQNRECPPCLKPVKVECFGKHEISELPCYKAQPYNCGRKCGETLKCTHHNCEILCHIIERDSKGASINCEICERLCEQPRPKGCIHECSNGLCHIGPCNTCKTLLRMKCHCKVNIIHVECQKWHESTKKDQDQMQSCKVPCTKTIECGHQCQLLCHPGECSKPKTCQEKVIIKCACKTNRKVFICNQIASKTVEPKVECTDKCDAKKVKLAAKTAKPEVATIDTSNEKQVKNSSKTNFNFTLIASISGFIILILSLILYNYFS